MPLTINLYNTLTRQAEPFIPMSPTHVRMYVCGPTVYDEAHLGHARCYMTWDTLYRFLSFMGYGVVYTRNLTDVDDKILKRAQENGEHPQALAERFTQRFHDVMAKLNTLPPTHEPKATEYVPKMVEFIQVLMHKGFAYTTASGTVYYDTSRKQDYGNLCHQNLDDLQSGSRVDVDPEKQSPLDFALWKPAPETEPYVWFSPWGYGRPGWHLECSTMSYHILGSQLDIHAGGMDLIFPHHQNEIAQTEAFTGLSPFVALWMHNGFVNVSGEKMSKSLGNFATVASLLEVYDANTLRYFVLTHHYRSPMDFNDFALEGAKNRISKMSQNVKDLVSEIGFPADAVATACKAHILGLINSPKGDLKDWEQSAVELLEAMAEDMNTAQALAKLNELLSHANPKPNQTPTRLSFLEPCALGAFLAMSEMLGFDFITPETDTSLDILLPELRRLAQELQRRLEQEKSWSMTLENDWTPVQYINEILQQRAQVRADKDWSMSDWIRDRLAALGILIKDRKEGLPLWHYEPTSITASP